MSKSIVIIGAGVAGPTAALRLTQSGHKCTIFERTAEPQTIGGAVNIAPNGMRLFSRLGVEKEIREAGCTVSRYQIVEEKGAALGSFENLSKDGFAGVRIMRSVLQKVLLEKAETAGVVVKFGMKLQDVNEVGGRVTAIFDNGDTASGDLLIGADGLHSRVRNYVLGDDPVVPSYTGQSLVYGILPTDKLPSVDFAAFPGTTAAFSRRGLFAMAFTTEARQTLYWITAKRKDVAEKSTDVAAIRAEECERYKELYDPIPQIMAATDDFFSWSVYSLPSLQTWHRGNVVLVGDAAHALPPNQGQGLSQAVEDVFILARVLDAGKGLDRYLELRKPRIDKLRQTIGKQRRENERGPWKQWALTWGLWAVLSVRSAVASVVSWDRGDFEYDPDKVMI